MGDTPQNFTTLQGNTISERKKNFSKILQSVAATGQIETFLQNLKPRNYLESLLRIDALIYFKRVPELLEILQQGNEVFISKIIKQKWFLREAFQDVNSKYLIDEFVPSLSFTIRKKLLKSILQVVDDKERINELFSALYDRYGLFATSNLIHYCSEEKIKAILQEEEVALQPNQTIYLYDTNYDLFLFYLNYYRKTYGTKYSEQKVVKYIGRKNPMQSIDLFKSIDLQPPKFGRRSTKKIFNNVKDNIVQEFNDYDKLLNRSVLMRKLIQTEKFSQVYYNIFPCKISDISYYGNEFNFLKYYANLNRWQLFLETFTKKINADIEELYKELNYKNQLKLLEPERDVIIKWAEVNFKSTENEDYLQFYPSSVGIPMLKDRIIVTSDISKRESFVKLLIRNCANNKDLAALEKVMNYIGYRHKNELPYFQHNVLSLIKELFDLNELTESHWNLINNQLKVLRIKDEFSFWRYAEYSKKYLVFLFKNNKNYDSFLKEFVQDCISEHNFPRFYLQDPELERKILLEVSKTALPEIEKITDKKLCLICTIISFDEEHPHHRINLMSIPQLYDFLSTQFEIKTDYSSYDSNLITICLEHKLKFPDFLSQINEETIIEVIIKSHSKLRYLYCKNYVTKSILKKERSNFEQTLANRYFQELYEKSLDREIVHWFIWNDPQFLSPHFPKVATKVYNLLNYKMIKLFSHFNFDTIMANELKTPLSSPNHEKKDILMNGLRVLLSTDEYIQLVNKHFLPEKEKLDIQDAKMMALYNIQCKIAVSLHKVIEPYKMLDVVIKFAVGDYLQSSLAGLYGVFYKSPEKLLPYYINILSQRAVSVRKHAVFLTCELLPQNIVINTLSTTKHENVSSQKQLFSASLKYLQKNPTKQLLDLVITNMKTVDKNDDEALNSLIAAKIPKKFRSLYIEKCWEFCETLHETTMKMKNCLDDILRKIENNIELMHELSTSFFLHIINNYFVQRNVNLQLIDNFIATLLRERIEGREQFFRLTFQVIGTMPKKQLREFFNRLINNDDENYKILVQTYWNETFGVVDTFYEHIYLQLWIFDNTHKDTSQVAKMMIQYMQSVLVEFGPFAFKFCSEAFNNLLSSQPWRSLELCYNMVQIDTSEFVCVLALHIAEDYGGLDGYFEITSKILEIMKTVEKPIVQIFYNDYLMKKS